MGGTATPDTGRFGLTFSGGPKAGACFHVTAGNRTDGPWTYTTEAAKEISDTWNTAYAAGVVDLTVHGPNGFLRAFRAPGREAGPEVGARHLPAGHVELTLGNAGTSTCRLTVTNAYDGRKQTLTVRPGTEVVHRIDPKSSGGWYDLSVVSDQDATFLRRLAGHVETGQPGVSDPALAVH